MSYLQKGWIIIIFGVFGFFVWAYFQPINNGILGSGILSVEEENTIILAPKTGLIKFNEIFNGKKVSTRDLLFEYNDNYFIDQIDIITLKIESLQENNLHLFSQLNLIKEIHQIKQNDFKRKLILKKDNFISDSYIDNLRSELLTSENQMKRINELIANNNNNILIHKKEINQINNSKDNEKVYSPIDGKIINLKINNNNFNVFQSQYLFEIFPDSSKFIVKFKISPDKINLIKEGDPVKIQISEMSYLQNNIADGTISFISSNNSDDRQSINFFEATAVFEKNTFDDLRSGTLVNIIMIDKNKTLLKSILDVLKSRLNIGLHQRYLS